MLSLAEALQHSLLFPVSLLQHPQPSLDGVQCAECADLKHLLLPLTTHVPACFSQHLPPHVQIQTPDNVAWLASWAELCMLGEMLVLKIGCESVGFLRYFLPLGLSGRC